MIASENKTPGPVEPPWQAKAEADLPSYGVARSDSEDPIVAPVRDIKVVAVDGNASGAVKLVKACTTAGPTKNNLRLRCR